MGRGKQMGRLITTVLLLLTLGGTSALGGGQPAFAADQGPEGAALQKGIELYQSGKPDAAISMLQGFVSQHYDSPLLPRAYLTLARIFRDQGEFDQALLYIERIPDGQRGPDALLVQGASLVGTGKTRQGISLLLSLKTESLSAADRILRYSALAQGEAQEGKPLQALYFIHQGLKLAQPPEQKKLFDQAHTILRDRTTDAELSEATFMFRDTAIGADAVLRQAQRAFAGGDEVRARRLVEPLVSSPKPFPDRRDAVLLLEKITGKTWLQRAVGVVLPLSGRYATFGKLVQRGMNLALEAEKKSDSPVRFLYRDSEADPDKSVQAVSELANEDGVMAIAGPLTGASADAAATTAQQDRVPLLAFSQKEGLPQIGDYVFRDSLTAHLQVQALVRYAMAGKGMTTFGILYPENALGRQMATLFSLEVEKRGGTIVAQQGYPENATDFGRPIKLLKGDDPDFDHKSEKEQLEDLFKPENQFDALFIPDYADQVGLIAPQLAFYGIDNAALLGINGWNSPELIRLAGRYVEGAVFVDGFFRLSPSPAVREFVNRYFNKFGEEPSILEAQGFDVARILLSLLDDPKVRTRDELRAALAQVRNFDGVTGVTSFNQGGEAQKSLFLLQVQQGNIVQIPQPPETAEPMQMNSDISPRPNPSGSQ